MLVSVGLLAGCLQEEGSEGTPVGGPAPVDIAASFNHAGHVLLSWEIPAGAHPERFEVYRDDVLVASLLPTARSFEDDGASPGTIRGGSLEASDASRGIALSWEAVEAKPGATHQYRVVAGYRMARSQPSAAVEGARAAPAHLGYRVLRDGALIAEPKRDAKAYVDEGAGRGDYEPPTDFVASQGAHAEGVQLSWSPASMRPGPVHSYSLEIVSNASAQPAPLTLRASRSLPSLRYELRRDGGAWFEVDGAAAAYLDEDAPLGRIQAQALAVGDRLRGFVELSLSEPIFRDPDPSAYELRVGGVGLEEMRFSATGYRAAAGTELTVQWQRGAPAPASDFRDLPDAITIAVVDLPATPSPHAYRALLRTAGATGISAPAEASVNLFESISLSTYAGCGIRVGDKRLVCWGDDEHEQAPPGPSDDAFRSVSVGERHACGVRQDGSLVCWGRDAEAYGPSRTSMERYVDVAVGATHSCARLEDGRIRCFGLDSGGRPLESQTRLSYSSLASGRAHWCAVRTTDGGIDCWGENAQGQGDAPAARFISVSAFANHSCGLTEKGTITCWGAYPGSGEPIVETKEHFRTVSAGASHGCGQREADGRIQCWGASRPLSTSHDPFMSVSSSSDVVCGLRPSGSLECWGFSHRGQAPAVPSLEAVRGLSAGGNASCAFRERDGSLHCVGYTNVTVASTEEAFLQAIYEDPLDEVAVGTQSACGIRRRDRKVVCWDVEGLGEPPLDERFRSITYTGGHGCGVREPDGKRVCWGSNTSGRAPPGPSEDSYRLLRVGSQHGCGILEAEDGRDGRVKCWGQSWGQPPKGITDDPYVDLAMGDTFSCGIREVDAKVDCWGNQAPDLGSDSFRRIAAGGGSLCGIRSADGKLLCAGSNLHGQAPRGPSEEAYLDLGMGAAHGCAIRASDRRLHCWGLDDYGGAPSAHAIP